MARFFSDAALSTPEGAKIARDILMIGNGIAVDHGGTVLRTGDGRWLDRDPGWTAVLERIASLPRIGPIACMLLPEGNEAKKRGLRAERTRGRERAAARKVKREATLRGIAERKAAREAKKSAWNTAHLIGDDAEA